METLEIIIIIIIIIISLQDGHYDKMTIKYNAYGSTVFFVVIFLTKYCMLSFLLWNKGCC